MASQPPRTHPEPATVPTVVDEWERRLELEGCLNFRDLGGYAAKQGRRVRRRAVFRSDALHHITRHDVAQLRELGLGDIIDLRSTAELRTEGRGPLVHEPVRFHHVPLFDGEPQGDRGTSLSLGERYFLLAELAKGPIARVITILADTTAVAVYHCAAGKDRTGVVTALLLGLLEVDDETIAADYALTQQALDAIIERLNESDGYQTMLATLPPETLHARPDTMREFLDRLRARYGSVAGYVTDAGVEADTVIRIRERLLER